MPAALRGCRTAPTCRATRPPLRSPRVVDRRRAPAPTRAGPRRAEPSAIASARARRRGRRSTRRRVGQVVARRSCWRTLAVLVVVFTVVGVAQEPPDRPLHDDGVAGHRHRHGLSRAARRAAAATRRATRAAAPTRSTATATHEQLPGTAFHRAGHDHPRRRRAGRSRRWSHPSRVVDTEHSSASVFVLPAVLAGVLLRARGAAAGGAAGSAATQSGAGSAADDGPAAVAGGGGSGRWRVALVRPRAATRSPAGAAALRRGRPGGLGPLERLLQAVGPDQVPGAGQEERDAEAPVV